MLFYKFILKLFPKTPPCGTCSNFSVSVAADSQLLDEFTHDRSSQDLDDYLESALNKQLDSEGNNGGGKKVYGVVLVNRDEAEGLRVVVGKYRHAWIEGRISNGEDGAAAVMEKIAEIFVEVFVNGGKMEGTIHGEFMPGGRVVLSFNLLNADPRDWVYGWYDD